MLRRVFEPNAPVSDSEITSFEERHRLLLPRSYRIFLLQTNGGRPEPPTFPIEGFLDNPLGDVQVFFGLNANEPTEDLDQVLNEIAESVPAGILPVGRTAGDDFICLDLRKRGAPVVFWNRVPFWGSNIWIENDLYPVAHDFDNLLQDLRDEPTP